jgi:hypothetical protein
MNEHSDSGEAPRRKMSEMISEIGAAFISAGKTLAERQNRLTAVCSAWNMACASPADRRQQLRQFAASYRRFNPAIPTDDLAGIVKDMETLIERKLTLFPDDHRQIVDARVVPVGSDFRIEVASARSK